MNTPLSWIKAYVPELTCTEQEYMDAMTMSGTKVEGYEKFDADLDKIIVGKIENLKMAVHIGSPKQGQWGQQGQTPISHTRTRDIIRWENHLSPACPQDYVRPELLKKNARQGG